MCFSYTINLLYCDDKGECVLVILSIYYIVIIKESVFLVILSIYYIVMIKETVFSLYYQSIIL